MNKENYKLESVTCRYVQEADTDSPSPDGDNFIEISSEGICYEMDYIVIKTERWAFDNASEFVELLNDFKKRSSTSCLSEDKDVRTYAA